MVGVRARRMAEGGLKDLQCSLYLCTLTTHRRGAMGCDLEAVLVKGEGEVPVCGVFEGGRATPVGLNINRVERPHSLRGAHPKATEQVVEGLRVFDGGVVAVVKDGERKGMSIRQKQVQ